MINKIGKYIRKIHRYLTPFFVIVTAWYMLFDSGVKIENVLGRVQKILMLTLAFTGAYLFFQIYYNRHKSKARKKKQNV